MQNTLFKKGLVIGIILLFIGMAFIPSFNAVSISKGIEIGDTRTLKVECRCDYFWNTPGWHVQDVIVKLSSDDGLINKIKISNGDGDCYFKNIPVYYDETNLNIDAKHIFNDFRFHHIKWYNQDCATVYFLFNWHKSKDDNILKNNPNVNTVNKETTDDCFECQSNGKTHLAEKLLNKLEKNEVISKDIKLFEEFNSGLSDRPICNMLEDLYKDYLIKAVIYLDKALDPYELLILTVVYLSMSMVYAYLSSVILMIYKSIGCDEYYHIYE